MGGARPSMVSFSSLAARAARHLCQMQAHVFGYEATSGAWRPDSHALSMECHACRAKYSYLNHEVSGFCNRWVAAGGCWRLWFP